MSYRSTIRSSKHIARLLAVLALVELGLSTNAGAHDPALHDFNMVTFERPFPAPDFALPDLAGDMRELASYRGRYVLLNFWATWCPPCVEEMPSMQTLHQQFSERGFTVVAASSDAAGASAVQPFVDKLGVTFPVLLDQSEEVAQRYGAQNLPVSFLINPEGQVIAAAQGARDWSSERAIEVMDELIVK